MSLCQLVCHEFPKVSADHGAWPRPALLDLAALQYAIDQRWHIVLISKLSKKASHVLEPRDHLRRQVDPRHKYQRQMDEHRHIGCLCFGARAARLAESDTIQVHEQCSEANEQSGNQQDPEQRLAGEAETEDEEIAHEDTGRRKDG